MGLFRVYDKKNHEWITERVSINEDGSAIELVDDEFSDRYPDVRWYDADKIAIEWTTGLNDDDNVPMYEGDIVRVNDEFIGEIRYIDYKSGFYVWFEGYNKFKKVQQAAELSYIVQYSDCVVIGNIHGLERED